MWNRIWTAAVAGVVALLLGGQQAYAQNDTVRLGGDIQAKTVTLAFDGQSDTTLLHGVRGHVGHYGYYGGGYRVGYSASYYGSYYGRSYVGYYGSYYQPYYTSYYQPYYASYYQPYYTSYYYQPYRSPLSYSSPIIYSPYYAPTVYYSGPSYSYYPISNNVQVGPPAQVSRPTYVNPVQPREQISPPTIPMKPADSGSYPYDGGPANPVPMPKNPGTPVYKQPGTPGNGDGLYVGLPAQQKLATQGGSTFGYQAYGDNMPTTTFATNRVGTITVTTTKKK